MVTIDYMLADAADRYILTADGKFIVLYSASNGTQSCEPNNAIFVLWQDVRVFAKRVNDTVSATWQESRVFAKRAEDRVFALWQEVRVFVGICDD